MRLRKGPIQLLMDFPVRSFVCVPMRRAKTSCFSRAIGEGSPQIMGGKAWKSVEMRFLHASAMGKMSEEINPYIILASLNLGWADRRGRVGSGDLGQSFFLFGKDIRQGFAGSGLIMRLPWRWVKRSECA